MNDIFSIGVLATILSGGIRFATSYIYAAIGEMFGQLSGVLNLGVEGIMLVSAFAAYYVVLQTENLMLGLLAAISVGGLMGLATAFISVTLKAEQGISGIGVYLFGLGLSDLLYRVSIKTVQTVKGFPSIHIPGLTDIPVIGPALFGQNAMVYGAFLLVPIAWFVVNKTNLGLTIRAVGQNPEAADTLGISVVRIRYITVTLRRNFFRHCRRIAVDCSAEYFPTKHHERARIHCGCAGVLWRMETVPRDVGLFAVQHGQCDSVDDSSQSNSNPIRFCVDDAIHFDDCCVDVRCTLGHYATGGIDETV